MNQTDREFLRRRLIERFGVEPPKDMTLTELFYCSPDANSLTSAIPERSRIYREQIAAIR